MITEFSESAESREQFVQPLTVKEMAPDDQPRERVLKHGIGVLSNSELLAIILRIGTRGYPITTICRDLMDGNNNSFQRLERCSRDEIMEINGLGELKAMQIEAVMEIVRRYCKESFQHEVRVTDASVIYNHMRYVIGNLPHEEMWVLFLTNANRIIGKMKVSEGSATATVFDTKKILRRALSCKAEALVLCHNHPSGNLRPSGPDDAITRRLNEACKTLDIRLLDHVIVTSEGFFSYRNETSILG